MVLTLPLHEMPVESCRYDLGQKSPTSSHMSQVKPPFLILVLVSRS